MTLVERLDSDVREILKRLQRIESVLDLATPPRQSAPAAPPPISEPEGPAQAPPVRRVPSHALPQRSDELSSMGQFLGIVAAICFVLAASVLVKLTIDSGWLTPVRQVSLAGLFGLGLVFIGIRSRARDISYLSLLPAAGIVVLYLTAAAGHAFYSLYTPEVAVMAMSAVSVLSLFLFSLLRTEIYVGFAVVGSYLASGFLPRSFDLSLLTTYFVIWDITFGTLAARLKSRAMILLACYMGLGLYQMLLPSTQVMSPPEMEHFLKFVAGVQFAQFLIFCVATVAYSASNKAPMSAAEAWAFFPILLFFYGLEYSILQRISPHAAPWISLLFAVIVYALYFISKRILKRETIPSTPLVHCFLSLVFLHAVYFELLPAGSQIWAGVLMALAWPLTLRQRKPGDRYWPLDLCFGIVVLIGYVRAILAADPLGYLHFISLGFAYFAVFAVLYFVGAAKFRKHDDTGLVPFILLLAHGQFIVASYRLLTHLAVRLEISAGLRPFLISSVWGVFALATLLTAKKLRDVSLGYSSLVILAVTTFKVFLLDVSVAAPLVRVACLIVLGATLYLCGYLMRTIGTWRAD